MTTPVPPGSEFLLEDRARYYPFSYDADEMPDLARAIEQHYSDSSGELDRWVRQFVNRGRPTETGALLMTLTNAIKESLSYERRTARGTQTPLQTLESRRGSCRGYATLMMEAARALGFATGFVSGYLYVPNRDSGESRVGGGSPMPGARSICRAPAGSNSTRPTASSGIATSSASRWRATPDRRSLFTGSTMARSETKRAWSSPSASAVSRTRNLRLTVAKTQSHEASDVGARVRVHFMFRPCAVDRSNARSAPC
jgi:hypothetical protein